VLVLAEKRLGQLRNASEPAGLAEPELLAKLLARLAT